MDVFLLAICTCLSCFIIARILFQFMNDRYQKTFQSKHIYYLLEIFTIIIISVINLANFWILNLIVWFGAIAIISHVFYFDETDSAIRRMIECEVLLLCMGVCETLGVVLINWMLKLFKIDLEVSSMRNCLEITFSKVIVIFLYYMIFSRLMSKKKVAFTRIQWSINGIILIFNLINMAVIIEGMLKGQEQSILTVNMGCIVLADLYLLYFIKISNEKNALEAEIEVLEKQANIQYKYYVAQEQMYSATVHILHDVDKHVKGIEKLYMNGESGEASEYAKEIKNMLEPLIPIKYTGNPILDILLADKAAISKEKKIKFDVKVDNINLDFLEAIDATTIFGNLIDNAIEATEKADNKYVRISISPYQEMVLIRIENTSPPLKWKNGMPVSEKGKNHGIGLLNVKRSIEKYDGDITFRQQNDVVTVDLLLNS